jgi:UDP-3-O-[3-hydroxymyristoyl] glucosamine N-acyltransferase
VPRFRPTPLGELAAALGRPLEGDPALLIRGAAALDAAGPADLAFVRSAALREALAASRAGAVLAPPGVDTGGRATLRSPHPQLDFARSLARLVEVSRPAAGVHPAAVLGPGARVDPSACVGPLAVVGARSVVGPRSILHAGVVVYDDVLVGADCVLHAGCVVREECRLGDRVVLHPGVVIGGDGFGYAFDEAGRPVKLPQIGRVVLEEDVEIGAQSAVDRAALGETRVRRNARIDNCCTIAHNCDIGEDVLMAAGCGIAGSTTIGRGTIVMGQAATTGHLTIGAGSFLGARTAVTHDLAPGSRVFGAPAQPAGAWHRSVAALARLPDALRRLRAVERRVGLRGAARGEGEER